jgi:hypothetical protein
VLGVRLFWLDMLFTVLLLFIVLLLLWLSIRIDNYVHLGGDFVVGQVDMINLNIFLPS